MDRQESARVLALVRAKSHLATMERDAETAARKRDEAAAKFEKLSTAERYGVGKNVPERFVRLDPGGGSLKVFRLKWSAYPEPRGSVAVEEVEFEEVTR